MSKRKLVSYHEDTKLRLGLPKNIKFEQSLLITRKRAFSDIQKELTSDQFKKHDEDVADPPTKVQAIGWPPVKSVWKNSIQTTKPQAEAKSIYVKVSMDGAPYLRKVDLGLYKSYEDLLKSLEDLFKLKYDKLSKKSKRSKSNNNGSEYEPTYEDKDGDWMLAGDVPWEMFITSCKRLRIMKGSDQSSAKLIA